MIKLSAPLSLVIVLLVASACAQNGEVSLSVQITRPGLHSPPRPASAGSAVVWLTPLHTTAPVPPHPSKGYTLTQRDKQFIPRLLVVPTGSSVDFPNLDPFFHNVFSLFNGKRFDLGLYDGHSSRKVQFDREGVSYIFCNIHPGMGAVVISLNTPFYALSATNGVVQLHGVPPGSYRLNVWAENVPQDRLAQMVTTVEITPATTRLNTVTLQGSSDMMSHHQNKFGEDYSSAPSTSY